MSCAWSGSGRPARRRASAPGRATEGRRPRLDGTRVLIGHTMPPRTDSVLAETAGAEAPQQRSDVLIDEEDGNDARNGEPAMSAGRPGPGERPDASMLIDVDALLRAYHEVAPDPADPAQRVSFGTSGHRGTATAGTFNEAHVLAISEAICRYRDAQGISGPLFLGRDTHALSEPAARLGRRRSSPPTASTCAWTPPAGRPRRRPSPTRSSPTTATTDGARADGIVITPSHNPPEDGGFKYNPPTGGPADTTVTRWIQDEANQLLEGGLADVRRLSPAEAAASPHVRRHDYIGAYVGDLGAVIDMEAIRAAGVSLGVDPLGGASAPYWGRDRRALRARHHRGQRPDRPDLPLRAARPRRQDPHGLLLAVRDGRA